MDYFIMMLINCIIIFITTLLFLKYECKSTLLYVVIIVVAIYVINAIVFGILKKIRNK